MRALQTFRRLTKADRLLLMEALTRLAWARLAILFLPFRKLGHLASKSVIGKRRPLDKSTAQIKQVRWAIGACARRVPWRAMCFEQGFAAQAMLRRRGIVSTLYFGAAPEAEKKLAAHVWVRAGGVDVVGCEAASQFTMLASFPPQPDEDAAQAKSL